jgi:hypothetical protein
VGRPLHIGISRLNRAIADYSLARLEFTISYPEAAHPPLLQRVGASAAPAPPLGSWAQTMKQVARLSKFVDDARAADTSLERDPVFDRLVRSIRQVGVLAWNMESMHRRSGGAG